jgi:hypothetical protein
MIGGIQEKLSENEITSFYKTSNSFVLQVCPFAVISEFFHVQGKHL